MRHHSSFPNNHPGHTGGKAPCSQEAERGEGAELFAQAPRELPNVFGAWVGGSVFFLWTWLACFLVDFEEEAKRSTAAPFFFEMVSLLFGWF